MQVAHARATFVTQDAVDESLTTIVARSVLEAALQEKEPAELWFELQGEDGGDVNRLSIDLSYSDIEELLSMSPEDEIALSLDGEALESLFDDADVEAHGMKGAIAVAVTSAALLAPGIAQAAVPQATQQTKPAATAQVSTQATAQVSAAATAQVSSLAAKTQVSLQNKPQISKVQLAKVSGLTLLRSGLARSRHASSVPPALGCGTDDGGADRRQGARPEGAGGGGRGRPRVRPARLPRDDPRR